MNREEAAEFTRKLVARAETIVFPKTPKTINNIPVFYFEAVLSALRGPQPDPITGLVPCGCGGKVDVAFYPGWHGVPDMYQVDCFNCHVGTRPCQTAEHAKAAWNTAMGWKGGAE